MDLRDQLLADLAKAELKAWESLARYKFWMFGYHAADVVRINRRLRLKRPNPFRQLVLLARKVCAGTVATVQAPVAARQSMLFETPECPGADCPYCNGEACNKCGAGNWNRTIDDCEHDVLDRHEGISFPAQVEA